MNNTLSNTVFFQKNTFRRLLRRADAATYLAISAMQLASGLRAQSKPGRTVELFSDTSFRRFDDESNVIQSARPAAVITTAGAVEAPGIASIV